LDITVQEITVVVDPTLPVQTIVISEGLPGEETTASNVNTRGEGVYLEKVGVDLKFTGIDAKDTKTTVEYDSASKTILVGTSLPEVMTSTQDPPNPPTGIPDGTIFFTYA
jgi:hypothetical protein